MRTMAAFRRGPALALCGVFLLAFAGMGWAQGSAAPPKAALGLLHWHRPYVKLTWRASRSRVFGYNVYRAGTAKGELRLLNATPLAHTHYKDRAVKRGRTYYYVVRAVAVNGGLSKPSNEVEASIQVR